MAEEKYVRHKLKAVNPLYSYLHRSFLNEKLNNWPGYLISILIAGVFGYLIANDLIVGLGIIALIIGIATVLVCVLNPEWGLYINMIYIFLAPHLSRFAFNDQLPIGVVTDILIVATFLGLFVGRFELKKDSSLFFKSKPVVYFLVVFFYLGLQLFNPAGHSVAGWFHIVRKVAESLILLFVAYNILSDYRKIWRYLKILFLCAMVTGFYGCIQQWHGLFPFEETWVVSDQVRYELIYILGTYRKFSFLSGPTEFGILMAACALLFIIVGIYEKKAYNKYLLITGSIFMILGMSYSGTRTANAMIVGGAAMFVLLTIHKKATKIFAFFAVMAFLFVMYAPIYSNLTILRFRSSFKAKEDASYMVREQNRAAIRPYIYSHPFGGGLSTTGEMGLKYNPGHPLAGFPPDSSYLNKALEIGWIGLALTLIMYFITLRYTIQGYFQSKNNKVKVLFAAAAAFFFSFYLGEVAQEAVGLFTNTVIYYPVLAMVIRLKQLGIKNTESLEF